MKYQEYQNWTAISIRNFRNYMAEVIEAMEDNGMPIILTRRGVPVVQMLPVSLRSFKNSLSNYKNLKEKMIEQNAKPDEIQQVNFVIVALEAKIGELTNNSKLLLKSQAEAKQILSDSLPLFQQYLNSSEDSAMVGTNTSAVGAEADKQEERSVVSPAKSVIKPKFLENPVAIMGSLGVGEKTSAKSEKSPPSGGTAAKGRGKR